MANLQEQKDRLLPEAERQAIEFKANPFIELVSPRAVPSTLSTQLYAATSAVYFIAKNFLLRTKHPQRVSGGSHIVLHDTQVPI